MRRIMCAALMVLLLGGCGPWSAEDRINAAIPVSAAVVAAQTAIAALATPAQAKAVQDELRARLKIRALQCAKGYEPSLLISAATIRDHLPDRQCFADADAALLQWLGLRHVGLLVTAEPRRPMPTGAMPVLDAGEFIQAVRFADAAGVAVLDTQQHAVFVDLGSGRRISSIDKEKRGAGGPRLSPNGRVALLPGDDDTTAYDVETGAPLARLDLRGRGEWLGAQRLLVGVRGSDPSQSEATLIDFASGKEYTTQTSLDLSHRMVPVPGHDDEFVIEQIRSLVTVEVSTEGETLALRVLKETPIERGVWADNNGGPSASGKFYINAVQDLFVTRLQTLDTESISFAPFVVQIAQPTADDDRVIIRGFLRNAPGAGIRNYLYSRKDRTLAAIDRTRLLSDRFVYVPATKQLAVIAQSRLVPIDELPLAEPQALEDFVVAAATASPLASEAPSLPAASGPFAELAKNASIEAIGVYEGQGGHSAFRQHDPGTVDVVVRKNARPILLVLSSYEPVNWRLDVQSGARLAGVLLSGYYSSTISGAGGAPQSDIGNAYCSKPVARCEPLDAEVLRKTGQHIAQFQGRYTGSRFTVGGF